MNAYLLFFVIYASGKVPYLTEILFLRINAHQDPLFRFFEREVKMGGKMLQDVRQDLSDVVQVCEGKKKQTNYLRTLISDLVKGKDISTSLTIRRSLHT